MTLSKAAVKPAAVVTASDVNTTNNWRPVERSCAGVGPCGTAAPDNLPVMDGAAAEEPSNTSTLSEWSIWKEVNQRSKVLAVADAEIVHVHTTLVEYGASPVVTTPEPVADAAPVHGAVASTVAGPSSAATTTANNAIASQQE